MITTVKTVCKSFKNTSHNYNGGWIVYFKLFVQAMEKLKEAKTTLKLSKTDVIKTKVALFLQCLFKPLKMVYSTISVQEGSAEVMIENDEVIGIRRTRVCKTETTHHLFRIPFFISLRGMTDKEILELMK